MPSAQQYRDNQRLGLYDERAGNEVAPGYQRGHGEASQDLPAISNTVTTLEKPPFIGRFSALFIDGEIRLPVGVAERERFEHPV